MLIHQSSSAAWNILVTLAGPLLSGIFIYVALSSLLVPFEIVVSLSVIISILIFGLTIYYCNNDRKSNVITETERIHIQKRYLSNIFIIAYGISIIFGFLSRYDGQIFVQWSHFTPVDLIRILTAVILSFFAPGYALVEAILGSRENKLESLPRFLLSYIFSILVTGMAGYITGSLGFAISDINVLLSVINLLIWGLYIYQKILGKQFKGMVTRRSYSFFDSKSLWKFLIDENFSKYLVSGCLFSLVIVSTYVLYNGKIIGDQFFHHADSLVFLSGAFKDLAVHNVLTPYPHFFAAILASFTTLSGAPSINAYVSLGFLNIMPTVAFYYFFSEWVPNHSKRTTLIATTLFMLSSGFGWVYALNLLVNDHISPATSTTMLNIFFTSGIKTIDIWVPNTFIDVGHPDITTPLIIAGLPAGFVLLGLLKDNDISSIRKLRYFTIVTGVSVTGYFFHDEFGLFIVIGCILILLYRLSAKSSIFAAILTSLSIAVLNDVFFPDKYYTYNAVYGIPFTFLYFLFVPCVWVLYKSQILYKLLDRFRNRQLSSMLRKVITNNHRRQRKVLLIIGIILVSIVSYLYTFSFIIWNLQIPLFDARINTYALQVIPWHFYPLRFGITGLFGLAFILSYVFKRFEREVFVFGIIAIVAFLTGPYYNEHRFNKYIMASMASFAALLIYKIVQYYRQRQNLKLKPLFIGLTMGAIVCSSSLSILMYAGYTALELQNSGNDQSQSDFRKLFGASRLFPSESEMHMLDFLRNDLNPRVDNVVYILNTSADSSVLLNYLKSFVALQDKKLFQGKFVLYSSTLEALYSNLNYTGTRYIILPTWYIHDSKISLFSRFVLENFKISYQDDKYLILSVPALVPPSHHVNIGLIAENPGKGEDIRLRQTPSLLTSYEILGYSKNSRSLVLDQNISSNRSKNSTELSGNTTLWSESIPAYKVQIRSGKILNLDNNSELFRSKNANGSATTTIMTLNPNQTALSKPILGEKSNYIEARFRILKEKIPDCHAGITWIDANQEYYVFLRPNLHRIAIYIPQRGEIASASVANDEKESSTLKVVYANGSINVFFNDVPKIHIPEMSPNNYNISRIGIRTYNTITKFGPLIAGNASMQPFNTNYAEVKFKLLSDRKPTFSHTGLVWKEGQNEYYALLGNDRLAIYSPTVNKEFLSTKLGLAREKGVWYTLKIVYDKRAIDIFLDDCLTLQIPKDSSYVTGSDNLSKVGIRAFDTVTEFGPVKIGSISNYNNFNPNFSYYYPLSALALSNVRYATFAHGDYSAFSKRNIILTSDYPINTRNHFLLEYVQKYRGNLFVLNTDDSFNGGFASLLNIAPGKAVKFDSITLANSKEPSVKVSGIARDIQIGNASDNNVVVKSYYTSNGKAVAPFAIEKKYRSDGGRIIFVNSLGYFNTIKQSPHILFPTLDNLPGLIGLDTEKIREVRSTDAVPASYFIGGMKASGHVTIRSTSLTFLKISDYPLIAQKILLRNQRGYYPSQINTSELDDTRIMGLRVYGSYNLAINSRDFTYEPSPSLPYGYVKLPLSRGSNVTLNLSSTSKAVLYVGGEKNNKTIDIVNGAQIEFMGLNSPTSGISYIPILIREPEIKINGNVSFEEFSSDILQDQSTREAFENPVRFDGILDIAFNHVDNSPIDTRQSITYIKWINSLGSTSIQDNMNSHVILPIPWERAIHSNANILILALIPSIIFITLWKLRSKIRMFISGQS